MSIASEITRINTNIANSYTAVDNKNGTLPQVQNSANLASAIDSIEVIEQQTAEGESLSLTNTKAMPYKDYVVKGKSTQSGEPSPDYPSEIHSVADDVNLLENMTIYNSNHYISPLLKLNPGTYTFNYTGDSAPGIYIRKNDGSNPTNGTVVDQKYTANNITFSISETGNYYIHLYSSTIWEQLTMNNPKLQKGTIATPYSPYNQGTVTIKQRGKNLFDGIFEYGGYAIDSGQKGSSYDRIRCANYIKVEPSQTYTFSFENTGSGYILEYDNNKTYLSKYTLIMYHDFSGSVTLDPNTEYITFYYIPYNHTLTLNEKCQIEKRNNCYNIRTISSTTRLHNTNSPIKKSTKWSKRYNGITRYAKSY